jgi:FAD/FMN-containing dehydrogenase
VNEVVDKLRAVLGSGGFIDDPALIAPYLIDFRRLYHGASDFIARPATTAQVAATVQICAENRVGIVPHGGNTSYCGGATPDRSGSQIILSLQRLNRIRALDADGFSVTAEAGCTLLEIQTAADHVQRLFPLSLGSEGTCQIGGNISTNAGGTAVLRYGMMRELVLGLEVVLPDGRVLDQLRTLRKDNTGYDVKQWFIGAEGTLGVVTAACLKLFPRPSAHVTAFIAVDDLDRAVALLSEVRNHMGDSVVAFEVMPLLALELVLKHLPGVRLPLRPTHPWYVLAEVAVNGSTESDSERFATLLATAVETGRARDAVLAASEAQRLSMWHIRENIPAAQSREGASIKHDVSLPIAAIPQFVKTAGEAAQALAPGARMVAYGHLGDGNLHFNFSQSAQDSAAEFLARADAVKHAVHDLVASHGGSISAEHGIGQLKVDELRRYENPVAWDLMRLLKRTLDPNDIMNPGKVLPQ